MGNSLVVVRRRGIAPPRVVSVACARTCVSDAACRLYTRAYVRSAWAGHPPAYVYVACLWTGIAPAHPCSCFNKPLSRNKPLATAPTHGAEGPLRTARSDVVAEEVYDQIAFTLIMSIDDNDSLATANKHLIPCYTDKSPILWDGNDATIKGALTQFALWSKRKKVFEMLIHHNAFQYKGIIFIDNPANIPFLQGTFTDVKTRSLEDMCPPSPARFAAYSMEPRKVLLGRAAPCSLFTPTRLPRMVLIMGREGRF